MSSLKAASKSQSRRKQCTIMHTCDILWASLDSITLIGPMMQQRVMSRVYLSPSQLRMQRSMVSRRHKGQANKRQIGGSFHIFHPLLCMCVWSWSQEAKDADLNGPIPEAQMLWERFFFKWLFESLICLQGNTCGVCKEDRDSGAMSAIWILKKLSLIHL